MEEESTRNLNNTMSQQQHAHALEEDCPNPPRSFFHGGGDTVPQRHHHNHHRRTDQALRWRPEPPPPPPPQELQDRPRIGAARRQRTPPSPPPIPRENGSHEEKKEEEKEDENHDDVEQCSSFPCPCTPPPPPSAFEETDTKDAHYQNKPRAAATTKPSSAFLSSSSTSALVPSPDDTARTGTTSATAASSSAPSVLGWSAPPPPPPPPVPLLALVRDHPPAGAPRQHPQPRRPPDDMDPHRYTSLRDVLPCPAPSPDAGGGNDLDDDADHCDDFDAGEAASMADFPDVTHGVDDDPDDDPDSSRWLRPPVSSLPVPPPTLPVERLSDHRGGRADYYRVTYRGVVALLQEPRRNSPKSGVYLGYGEVFLATPAMDDTENEWPVGPAPVGDRSTRADLNTSPPRRRPRPRPNAANDADTLQMPPPPPPSLPWLPGKSETMPSDRHDSALLVRHVLTGGYAREEGSNAGPGRWGYLYPHPNAPKANPKSRSDGAAAEERIVERLFDPPGKSPPPLGSVCWTVRVVAPAPVPVLAGPCDAAPRTAATLLPGTMHDVSLAFGDYLRLHHRRGWIRATQQHQATASSTQPAAPTVVAIVEASSLSCDGRANTSATLSPRAQAHADSSTEGASLASGTTATLGDSSCTSFAGLSHQSHSQRHQRARHRPPRRAFLPLDGLADALPRSRHHPTAGMPVPATHTARASSPGKVLDATFGASLVSDSDEPDEGCASSEQSSQPPDEPVYLMRVWNPQGLKILDAPHFAVSHLIRGGVASTTHESASNNASASFPSHSHFRGGFATVPHLRAPHPPAPAVVFDAHSRTRRLPAGAYFEARTLLQPALYHGEGLIQLLDKTGWAVIPSPSDVETVAHTLAGSGNGTPTAASLSSSTECGSEWVRVAVRAGVAVVCPPPPSLSLSLASTAASNSSSAPPSPSSVRTGASGSDVASSVGSSLLDVFRTPTKKPARATVAPKEAVTAPSVPVIPCGTPVRVNRPLSGDYARLCNGQGWIPLRTRGRNGATDATAFAAAPLLTPPEHRWGSFWFRVQAPRGIRARIGPSRRAPSIRSAAAGARGVAGRTEYLRFECGEFLRASEILTILPAKVDNMHETDDHNDGGGGGGGGDSTVAECYCKLYRNRHAALHQRTSSEHRPLEAYTAPAEWVQVYDGGELFLEECAREPRIERHPQGGWKYRATRQVSVRRGPSFAAETVGLLEEGDTVLVLERVAPPGDPLLWLRLKDGAGWVHDTCHETKESLLVPHSHRHKPKKDKEEIPYNTIIARLFHTDDLHQSRSTSNLRGGGL